jgi:hypothetical protein
MAHMQMADGVSVSEGILTYAHVVKHSVQHVRTSNRQKCVTVRNSCSLAASISKSISELYGRMYMHICHITCVLTLTHKNIKQIDVQVGVFHNCSSFKTYPVV